MRVEIKATELMQIAHCYSDKLLDDLLMQKGIDIARPFTKYMDFTLRKLIVEQDVLGDAKRHVIETDEHPHAGEDEEWYDDGPDDCVKTYLKEDEPECHCFDDQEYRIYGDEG